MSKLLQYHKGICMRLTKNPVAFFGAETFNLSGPFLLGLIVWTTLGHLLYRGQ